MTESRAEHAAAIEQRTIAQVPDDERHGKVRNLFTIWFGSNVMLLTIVTGARRRWWPGRRRIARGRW